MAPTKHKANVPVNEQAEKKFDKVLYRSMHNTIFPLEIYSFNPKNAFFVLKVKIAQMFGDWDLFVDWYIYLIFIKVSTD